jgi:GNAT superfamily N-acetyltransferase
MNFRLVRPESLDQWAAARRLIEAYAASLDFKLCFQGFEAEVQNLPREYGPPAGALLLATRDSDWLGCVALRKFSEGVSEMKRLYVAPASRGLGIGRALVEGIIAEARRLGYRRMVLDTVPSMRVAQDLYLSLGFAPIPAYRENPIPGALFYELKL